MVKNLLLEPNNHTQKYLNLIVTINHINIPHLHHRKKERVVKIWIAIFYKFKDNFKINFYYIIAAIIVHPLPITVKLQIKSKFQNLIINISKIGKSNYNNNSLWI